MRSLSIYLVALLCSVISSSLIAEACTYAEAITAYNQGNSVRARVLMRMAARDGDTRAVAALAQDRQQTLSRIEPALSSPASLPEQLAHNNDDPPWSISPRIAVNVGQVDPQ